MSTALEIRTFVDPIEIRAVTDGDQRRLVARGTAIRYGALSRKMGSYVERIQAGAPDEQIQTRNINIFHEHPDPTPGKGGQGLSRLLGTTEAGTLRLRNSTNELKYEVDLPDTSAGRDAAVLLERGDLRGSSYGFLSDEPTDKWSKSSDGLALRTVTKFRVFDHIALTCSAAYPSSTSELGLRSLASHAHLELRAVMAAAEADELADLIDSVSDRLEDPDGAPQELDDDGKPVIADAPKPVYARRRIVSLYL